MIFGRDFANVAIVAVLMVLCGGGIARLLWLIEGRPHLDRPRWWPGAAKTERAALLAAPPAVRTSTRATSAVACAACCGVPMLLVAGVLGVGAVATFSLVGGALLAVALAVWAVATGRATRWRRMLSHAARIR